MGDGAEDALRYCMRCGRYGTASFVPVQRFDKMQCPICGGFYGGAGDSAAQGVHAHLKYKHGINKKHQRDALLGGEK